MKLRRIHVVGGPGSGKTTVARRLGERLGLPVHGLDDVHRVGGGVGPVRADQERADLVAGVLESDGWVTEGVHLGWTDPLVDQADLVIWLDHLSWRQASRRIVRRFAVGAAEGVRTRSGHRRFTRFSDYARHLRALAAVIVEVRRYHVSRRGTANLPETRAATADRLARRAGPVIRCRTSADVADLERRVGAAGS